MKGGNGAQQDDRLTFMSGVQVAVVSDIQRSYLRTDDVKFGGWTPWSVLPTVDGASCYPFLLYLLIQCIQVLRKFLQALGLVYLLQGSFTNYSRHPLITTVTKTTLEKYLYEGSYGCVYHSCRRPAIMQMHNGQS